MQKSEKKDGKGTFGGRKTLIEKLVKKGITRFVEFSN